MRAVYAASVYILCVAALVIAAYADTPGHRLLAMTPGIVGLIVWTLYLIYQEDIVRREHIASRLDRLQQLGIVERWYDHLDSEAGLLYEITTTGGDTYRTRRSAVTAYIDGLAHGAWAQEGDHVEHR